ncbi:MAG: hypothetical protein H6R15_944 [Proteobacteria bacterium]|nr:hypothetical protein [Pseudomonadota bacterium]
MSLKQTIAALVGVPSPSTSDGNIARAAADTPLANTTPARNFLPGLRPVQNEVEVYFRDAFAGRAI